MNMAEETAIKVKGLYKLYRVGEETVRALNGVDFEIKKGEFCSIVELPVPENQRCLICWQVLRSRQRERSLLRESI